MPERDGSVTCSSVSKNRVEYFEFPTDASTRLRDTLEGHNRQRTLGWAHTFGNPTHARGLRVCRHGNSVST